MKKNGVTITVIILLVIVFAVYLAFIPVKSVPGQYDKFAQCLKNKGALFYGAFWCPHCRDQKDLLGKSASKLPYVECSTPDGKSQLSSCAEVGIKSYPTWIFADGEKIESIMTLEQLSSKTSCPLILDSAPETSTSTVTN